MTLNTCRPLFANQVLVFLYYYCCFYNLHRRVFQATRVRVKNFLLKWGTSSWRSQAAWTCGKKHGSPWGWLKVMTSSWIRSNGVGSDLWEKEARLADLGGTETWERDRWGKGNFERVWEGEPEKRWGGLLDRKESSRTIKSDSRRRFRFVHCEPYISLFCVLFCWTFLGRLCTFCCKLFLCFLIWFEKLVSVFSFFLFLFLFFLFYRIRFGTSRVMVCIFALNLLNISFHQYPAHWSSWNGARFNSVFFSYICSVFFFTFFSVYGVFGVLGIT